MVETTVIDIDNMGGGRLISCKIKESMIYAKVDPKHFTIDKECIPKIDTDLSYFQVSIKICIDKLLLIIGF